MPAADGRQYLVGDFLIDTARYRISSGGDAVPVEPKVFDLLVYLIRNRDRVVTREELFETVWEGRPVSDATLSNHIKSARKALGDSGELQQTIQTVRGRGYQFIASVSEVAGGAAPAAPTTPVAASPLAALPVAAPVRRPGRRPWVLPLTAFLLLAAATLFWWPRSNNAEVPVDTGRTGLLVVPLDIYGPRSEAAQLWANQLTRELIDNLKEISGLRTKERATSFSFENPKDRTHASISKKLPDVRYVLGGRMESQAGTNPFVIMELDDLMTGKRIWKQRYTVPSYSEHEGYELLRSIITKAVTASLEVTILEDEQRALERLGGLPTKNKEAMELYVQGWKYLLLPNFESLKKAVSLFDSATRLDPDFYDAHLAKGKALRWIYAYYETPKLAFPGVVEAFEAAQRLRNDAAEPLAELGLTYALAWKWTEAWNYLDAAKQKSANLATTELGLAIYYSGLNQADLVKQSLQRAEQIDPLNLEIADWGNWALFLMGETAASRDWGIRMMDRHPTVGFIFTDAAIGAYMGKEYPRAIDLARKGLALDEASPLAMIVAAQAYGHAGQTDKVRPLLEQAARSEYYACPYETAVGYLSIGDTDRAMQLLEVAHDKWSNCLVFLRVDPRLDPIRKEPYRKAYLDLLDRVGLAEEKFNSYPLCRGPDGAPGRDCGGVSR
jgi:DNA-binding winged helix-turn-helix (wHTH) protein/TolB-like protein/tetratricopeptide (TPR) repeat protein